MNLLKLIPLEERIVLDAAAAAHVIYVNSHAAAGGDGSSWAHAYTNVQDALAKAAASPGADQIWIAQGTYSPGANRADTFTVPDQTSLYGGFKGTETNLSQRNPVKYSTILSGNIGTSSNTDNTYTLVTLGTSGPVTATLDGLSVIGAYNDSNGLGGGLSVTNGSNLTLSHMIFANDFAATRGGGVFAANDLSLSITDSQFLNNNSVRGGGVRSENTASVTIARTDFNGNHALIGGGLYSFGDASLNLSYSTFENNSADVGGGPIRTANDQNVSITHNSMNNNVSAIILSGSTNILFDSNLVNNVSATADLEGDGGLLTGGNENLTVTNNTFSNNIGTGQETTGGFTTEGDGTVLISKNLFYNNQTQDPTQQGAGGGLAVVADDSATISSNSFIGNTADYGAGLLALANNSIVITQNLFSGNIASAAGGAISLGITNPTFAIDLGPGDTNATVSQNIFLRNSAGDLGGAIASGQELNLTVSQNVYTLNQASRGGALGDLSSVTLAITSNVFAHDLASQGREIWLDGGQTTVNGVSSAADIINRLVKDNASLLSSDIEIV